MLQLAYSFDDTVEIDGVVYDLDMSFDNILRLYDLLKDKEVTDPDKVMTGIEMLLNVCFLHDTETQTDIFVELFENAVGKEAQDNQPVDLEGNPVPQPKEKRVYSLQEDADYIYASFYQDYGIDLHEMHGVLHWEKFKALLGGLRKDTRFKEVIEIRTMELPTGKGSAKQRENIQKLKRHYALKGDD